MSRPISKGDYLLLPYRGKKIDLLVRVRRRISCDIWACTYCKDGSDAGYLSLSTTESRIAPSAAKQILRSKK